MTASKLPLRLQMLILVLVVGFVIWLLAPALTPFVVAATFAYLFNPLVGKLQRLKLSRSLATTVVFLLIMLLLVLVLLEVVPYLQRQVTTLIRRLPDLFAWLQNDAVAWLNARFGRDA